VAKKPYIVQAFDEDGANSCPHRSSYNTLDVAILSAKRVSKTLSDCTVSVSHIVTGSKCVYKDGVCISNSVE